MYSDQIAEAIERDFQTKISASLVRMYRHRMGIYFIFRMRQIDQNFIDLNLILC